VSKETDPGATLDEWRARGAHSVDPVRFRLIEALARRAAAHGGDARRILDDKVARLLAAYGDDLDKALRADGHTAGVQAAQPHRTSLAELIDHIARQAPAPAQDRQASDVVPSIGPSAELKTLAYFRDTWSRLSADHRLTQSLEKVPANAGPLNSHHLVQQSLTLMRELSPQYLSRFLSHVDALLWLEQARGGSAPAGKDAPRGDGDRKAARGRSKA
jgi:hypothetical protein